MVNLVKYFLGGVWYGDTAVFLPLNSNVSTEMVFVYEIFT